MLRHSIVPFLHSNVAFLDSSFGVRHSNVAFFSIGLLCFASVDSCVFEVLQVCALLGGGGYAEKINVPAVQVFPIPKGIKLVDAAGIPEVACTVWSTIFMTCHLSKGESLLVQ